MKWLKKDSSEDDQIPNAESQPEQQPPEEFETDASEPEALEQPEVTPEPESPDGMPGAVPEEEYPEESPAAFETQETDTVETEAESAWTSEKTSRKSRRRRDRPQTEVPAEQSKPGSNPLAAFAGTWIGKNWKVMAILVFIFCMALFVRSYYGLVPATENGFILSGGSDSYYHNYVIDYASSTGDHHFWDNMLNYPLGTRNPRPPLYDWSVAMGGIGLSPMFGGNVHDSIFYVFLFSTAFWGALTIFPTYFLAKEAFGKKTGIIAAFLLAIMPGHIQRSVLTNADHDAMALFFIVTAFFFFLKALKYMKQREWVTTWKKPGVVIEGTRKLIAANRVSLLYAVMAGLSLASVSLIWKGYAYAIVIMSVYLLIQLLLNRFRNIDSLGLLAIYFVTVGIGLMLAFPYYYLSIQIKSWFDMPSIIWIGATAFAMILVVTKKYPWVLVFSSMIGLGLAFVLALALVAPSALNTITNAILSGAGYFIQNKQYQTIAEAQAPPFSNLAMSFGIITFWLSFVGIAWAAIQLPKSWKSDFTFIFIWSATSIYMAVAAARFMFNAGPAFSITAGWVITLLISKLNIKQFTENMRRAARPHMSRQFEMALLASTAMLIVISLVLFTISGLAYPVFVMGITVIVGMYILNLISETNPNKIYNLIAVLIPATGILFYILTEFYTDWVLTGATHGFVLFLMMFGYFILYMTVRKSTFTFTAGMIFLAFLIIMPNVWGGLDAGIPYETKNVHDLEIYQAAPLFIQSPSYDAVNGSNWFLGGFGYSLPLNSRYWPAAYDWLATQDTNIYPPSDRPAFLSWWDYGFEVVNEGKHPTVADNFLGGHQLAGNFIMSQSEKDAIALLCARIIEGKWDYVQSSLDPAVASIIQSYGISVSKLDKMMKNPGNYKNEILAHPEIYGPRDDILQDANARYILVRVLITDALDEEGVVNLYDSLCKETGFSIRYFGIDSRLFPFSSQNTGIFYAPAKLSDHRIDPVGNQPYDFWEIKAVGQYGGLYNLSDIPQDVKLDQKNPYKIVYHDMFYNSMLYKAFIGYSGMDIGKGADAGIPGISGTMSKDKIMPGWNMTHFKLEHRTAYWNPYGASEIQNHTNAWQAMNFWDAYRKQQAGDGISDLSDRSSLYQGVMMLKYYDGAIISGNVTLKDGSPLGGVSVTVADEFGIPHQRVVTKTDGSYSIIAPYGNITLTISSGTVDPLNLVGSNKLNVTNMHIEDYQAMRENEDRNNDGRPDYLINHELIIDSGSLGGAVFWDENADGKFDPTEKPVPNADLHFSSKNMPYTLTIRGNDTGDYYVKALPPGSYSVDISEAGISLGQMNVTVNAGTGRQELLAIKPYQLIGAVSYYDNGDSAMNATISLWNHDNRLEFSTASDSNGNYSLTNVLPGDYFCQAIKDTYASSLMRIHISKTSNNTQDFTLIPSAALHGRIILPNGSLASDTMVRFAGRNDTYVVQSDAHGEYRAILKNGDYDIDVEYSSGSETYVALESMFFDSDATHDIYLAHGVMVSGVIRDSNNHPTANARVLFENVDAGFSSKVFTDNQGTYSIKIPEGNYVVQADTYGNLTHYLHKTFTRGFSVLDISATKGAQVYGTVFWDQNGDGAPSEFEVIKDARVSFIDPSGTAAMATTDANGRFMISLYPSTTYKSTVKKAGFETLSLGTFTPEGIQLPVKAMMMPFMLPVSGTLYLDDKPLTGQNIRLSFISTTYGGESKDVQVSRDGTYSTEIIPGVYTVTFTHNMTVGDDSLVYQIDKNLRFQASFYLGESAHLDIHSRIRHKVSVSIIAPSPMNANVSFTHGPEEHRISVINGTGETYVMAGNYVISASNMDNGTFWVGMQDVSVSNATFNLPIYMEEGKKVSGTLRYISETVPDQLVSFRDMSTNGSINVKTDNNGVYEAVLAPNRHYNVVVDYVKYDNKWDAFHYFANKTMDSQLMSQTYNINVEREEYYSNISGRLSNAAPGVDIVFHSLTENITVTTDSLGQYNVALRPGVYSVYIHDRFSNKGFLDVVVIDTDTRVVNFEMGNSYRIHGTVYYDLNQHGITELTLVRNISMISIWTDMNGFYDIWLPTGKYTVSAAINALKDGINVQYQTNRTFEVTDTDKQMNLPLSMIEDRNVVISYDDAQLIKTKANATITYEFIVKNVGNIQDTYDLTATGGNPDWAVDLSTNVVSLKPGTDNYARVEVTAAIPPGARVDQNNINIIATSQNDHNITGNAVMAVKIEQTHSIAIEPSSTSPSFSNSTITSQFAVKNNGNGDDKLTLYIGNLEDLKSDGWKAELGNAGGGQLLTGNTMMINLSVKSGGISNIPITLTPIEKEPSRQTRVLITGFSQGDNSALASQYIILRYPELRVFSDNVTIVGDDVTTISTGDNITNIGVMAASVSVALGLFYYARKRRWIR